MSCDWRSWVKLRATPSSATLDELINCYQPKLGGEQAHRATHCPVFMVLQRRLVSGWDLMSWPPCEPNVSRNTLALFTTCKQRVNELQCTQGACIQSKFYHTHSVGSGSTVDLCSGDRISTMTHATMSTVNSQNKWKCSQKEQWQKLEKLSLNTTMLSQ